MDCDIMDTEMLAHCSSFSMYKNPGFYRAGLGMDLPGRLKGICDTNRKFRLLKGALL